ncbi:MAG TPA: serine/threonine-protein kinase [Pyrinomonadaceae bacterium]|jgi:serine/threonine protein kinase
MAQNKIGSYTLISQIGRGGFGVVWLAEKRTAIATTRFALKLARDEDVDIEAFKHEAVIWAQVSGHPNVLPIIEADIYDGQAVIVSEYAPGGSLQDWLKKHGGRAPSIEAAVEMATEILDGLEYLHEQRIIHRDLKPDNILLQRETPRLADFGIARVIKTGSYSQNLSGTFAYMAPEAFDGKRNEQTDVWSVGVILYQMLAGRLPYDQPDIVSLVGAIVHHDPPPLPDSIPDSLRSAVMRALKRDTAERYQSAAEMRRDLRAVSYELWRPHTPETAPNVALIQETRRSEPPNTPTPVSVPFETVSSPYAAAAPPPPKVETTPQPTPAGVPQTVAVSAPQNTGGAPVLPTSERARQDNKGGLKRSTIVFGVAGVMALVLALGLIALAVSRWWQPYITGLQAGASNTAENSSSFNLKQTLGGHSDSVIAIAFSSDGKQLASGSADKTFKLWDTQTGALEQTVTGHSHGVHAIAYSPDGKTLATGSDDKTIKLWNAQTGALKQTLTGHGSAVHTIAFSPDGKQLASGSTDKTVKLWDTQSGELKEVLTGHSETIKTIAYSPDGETLASGSDDKTIKLWDPQTGALKQTLTGHSSGIHGLAYSPDGKLLASASIDKTIKLWDAQTGALKQTLTGHSDGIHGLAFSSKGTLASASMDKTIKLWDAQTGALKQTLTGHSEAAYALAFSPDGKQLASGSIDKTIKLWTLEP